MNNLTPAGMAALQHWASDMITCAFVVGIVCGFTVVLSRDLAYRFSALALSHWHSYRHRQTVAEWECSSDAADVRRQAIADALADHREATYHDLYAEVRKESEQDELARQISEEAWQVRLQKEAEDEAAFFACDDPEGIRAMYQKAVS